jgi:hypothetical protein
MFLVMIVVVAVVIPIALGMPPVIRTAPVAVVGVPATFAFGVQVATATLCLGTTLPMMTNRVVEPCFGLLDAMLTFRVVIIGPHLRNCGKKQGRAEDRCRDQPRRDFQRLLSKSVQSMPPAVK